MIVNDRAVMTNELYQKTFKVSRRTAVRDLQGLVESNQIKYEGVGKGTKYKA